MAFFSVLLTCNVLTLMICLLFSHVDWLVLLLGKSFLAFEESQKEEANGVTGA